MRNATCAAMICWCLAVQARPGELATKVIPGTVVGNVKYVPGRYGLGASLEAKMMDGEPRGGIAFPCSPQTFSAQRGTFGCWLKATWFPCVGLFQESAGNYALGVWWEKEGGPYFPFVFVYNKAPDGYNGLIPTRIEPGYWCHLVLTWDMASRSTRTFINGNEADGSPRMFPPAVAKIGNTLRVGTFFSPEAERYDGILTGLIDEVVFTDKALGAEEVKALFFSGPYTPDEHTRLYINFDQGNADGISAAMSR